MCQDCVDKGLMSEEEAATIAPMVNSLLAQLGGRSADVDPVAKFEADQQETITMLIKTASSVAADHPGKAPHELGTEYASMAMFQFSHKESAILLAELAFYFLRANQAADKITAADADDDLADVDPLEAYAVRLADAADETRGDVPGLGIRDASADQAPKAPGMYL